MPTDNFNAYGSKALVGAMHGEEIVAVLERIHKILATPHDCELTGKRMNDVFPIMVSWIEPVTKKYRSNCGT